MGRADRTRSLAEHDRDFGIGQPGQQQIEEGSLFLGQAAFARPAQLGGVFVADRPVLGTALGISRIEVTNQPAALNTSRAVLLVDDMVGDAEEPSREGIVIPAAGQPAECPGERLLGGLFRVRDYFPTVFAYNPKPTYTTTTIPNPDTNAKGYLDAFGFRRVGR